MIVICTRCQAKFRVADDKVGPRGARARCARCQQVFLVRRPEPAPERTAALAPAPAAPTRTAALALDLEPPSQGAALEIPPDDPFAAFHAEAERAAKEASDPFASPAPSAGSSAPFASGPADGWASDDPFGGAPEPFSPRLGGDLAGPEPDFAAPDAGLALAGDPFAASISSRADRPVSSGPALPVTDLADLVGAPASAPTVPPPLPLPPRRPAPPPAGPLAAGLDAGAPGPDLALEERTTRQPVAARGAGDDFLGLDSPASPFLDGGPGAGPSELGVPPAAAGEEPLALATEPDPWAGSALDPAPPGFAPAPQAAAEPVAETPTAPAPASPPVPPPASEPARKVTQGGGALRRVLVNAVALAALLAVALAFRVLWGGHGASVRSPATLLGAVGIGGEPAGVLVTSGVTSGRYARASGPPLLFVRGEVISRAPGPMAGVEVEVQVIRHGRVLVAGGARAGAVPTAEELHAVKDAAALDALSAALARRAPAAVRPGEEVPFLVAFADAPEDLSDASIRVIATQVGGAR